jgi:hypothetical protein
MNKVATGANFSTTSAELLCTTCKFGQVVESAQGGTAIICHYAAPGCESAAIPQRLDMLVTKCSRYELPQMMRIWDTALALHIEDGHCWSSHTYVPALGHVHQRVDTVGKRIVIFKEHPDQEWDSQAQHFVGEPPPVGHRVAKWFRRLRQ